MLEKMGWKGDASGLGKNQQGTTTNLRAVRRSESLGIGAETDAFGDKAWDGTSKNYAGVLANLQKEYGGDVCSSVKKEKKRKRKEEKRAKKKTAAGDESSDDNVGGGGSSLRLAQNKVQAGHARKMRDAKDIRNKSAADMAAVFGVKADFYKGLNASIQEDDDDVDSDECDNNIKEKKKSKKRKNRDRDGKCEASNDGERRKKKKSKRKTA